MNRRQPACVLLPPTLPRKVEIEGLQVLRALAAFAVVVHHTMEESGASGRSFPDWLTTVGAAGVDVFFVISGFIMLVTSFDLRMTPLTPGRFLLKRLTRIYPFYWLCTGAMAAIMGVGLLTSIPRDPWFFMRSALLLPSLQYVISVSWTLAYELLFYLAFTGMLFTRSRDLTVIGTVITITMVVAGAFFGLKGGDLRVFLENPIMFEFCFGLGLAWVMKGRIGGPPLWLGIAAGLAIFLASATVRHDTTAGLNGVNRVVAWGIPSILIVWSAVRFTQVTSRLGTFGVRLGNSSYALYLTHPFVMISYAFLLKHSVLKAVDQRFIVPFVVVVAVYIGWLAYTHVERRLLSVISRLLKRPVGVASPSEQLQ